MKKLLIALIIFSFISIPLIAGDVGLAWDASLSSNVTNYRVYWGSASRSYTSSTTIGNLLTHKVTALPVGNACFAVTAIDASANESDFSNEVCTIVGGPPAAPGNFRFPPVVISGTNPAPKVVVSP